MTQDEGQIPMPAPANDSLEQYRRMIELQRQLIELARKHEQSRRECELLRGQVEQEVNRFCNQRPGWSLRARNFVSRFTRHFSQFTARLTQTMDADVSMSSPRQSSET